MDGDRKLLIATPSKSNPNGRWKSDYISKCLDIPIEEVNDLYTLFKAGANEYLAKGDTEDKACDKSWNDLMSQNRYKLNTKCEQVRQTSGGEEWVGTAKGKWTLSTEKTALAS